MKCGSDIYVYQRNNNKKKTWLLATCLQKLCLISLSCFVVLITKAWHATINHQYVIIVSIQTLAFSSMRCSTDKFSLMVNICIETPISWENRSIINHLDLFLGTVQQTENKTVWSDEICSADFPCYDTRAPFFFCPLAHIAFGCPANDCVVGLLLYHHPSRLNL